MHIRFIISTKSGVKDRSEYLKELITDIYAENNKSIPDIQLTKTVDDIKIFSKEWCERFGDNGIVYICGGDGAINECANALYGSLTYMGVVPFGTGNDFAKYFYPRKINTKILRNIIKSSIQPSLGKVDLLKVNDYYSINVVSMGFDTIILKSAYNILKTFPWLGKLAYGLSVMKNIGAKKQFKYRYILDTPKGKVENINISSVVVFANAKYYGSGFMPTPMARINDGIGNSLISDKLNILDVMQLVNKYSKGKHIGHKKLQFYEFSEAEITSLDNAEIIANFDGNIFSAKSIKFKLLPDALNFAYIKI